MYVLFLWGIVAYSGLHPQLEWKYSGEYSSKVACEKVGNAMARKDTKEPMYACFPK